MEEIRVKIEDESEEIMLTDTVVKEEYFVRNTPSPEYQTNGGNATWEQDLPGNVINIKEEGDAYVEPEEQPKQQKRKYNKYGVGRVKIKRTYKCTLCGKKYFRCLFLRKHFETVHPTQRFLNARNRNYYTPEKPEKPAKPAKETKPKQPKPSKQPKVKIVPKQLRSQSNEKRYECEICYKAFFKEKEVTDHILDNHIVQSEEGSCKKEYMCPLCNKSFGRKVILSAHLSRNHIKIKSIRCIYCGSEFSTEKMLIKHLSVCLKLFHCKICQQHFTTENGLQVHSRVHMNNPKSSYDSDDTLSASESPHETSVQDKPQSQEIQQSDQPIKIITVHFVECQLDAYIAHLKKIQNKK